MAGPLVSVFVPAYNAERYLGRTLKSILAQTHASLEVVVLDDASTDGTAGVVAGFDDPRLRYVRNERNLGQFRTMSRAAELTRGDFVAIYHADDLYEPTIVETELAFLLAHPEAGAVFAQDCIIDEHDRWLCDVAMPAEFAGRSLLRYEDVFPYLLRNKNQLLCCPTFMTRRCVLLEVGGFDAERYKIAGDLDYWLRVLRRAPVGVLPQRLVRYRRSREQESSKYKRMRTAREEFFDIVERYAEIDGWWERIGPVERREYGFHRFDDDLFRAANLTILGRADDARPLVAQPYPWRSLIARPKRRKLRMLLMHAVMRALLSVGAAQALARLLRWSEYGDRTGVALQGTVGVR